MRYIQILTSDDEYFIINLDQQIYIKISTDSTHVSFLSRSYRLVFTTDEKSPNGTLIRQDTMDLLQEAVIGEVSVYTDPDV
jgi:hypothetical protein